MFNWLRSRLGPTDPAPARENPLPPFSPYERAEINFLYNLLFCDDLAPFQPKDGKPPTGPWAVLLAPEPDLAAVAKIADDEAEESRVRALAFSLLRARGVAVKPKIVLGVIIEMPQRGGLDTLAVYADGRVRYLNQSGKVAVVEGGQPELAALAAQVIAAAQPLANALGPWDKPRLPPPPKNLVRLSLLVSDGLYFGQAAHEHLQREALAGPPLAKATELLLKLMAGIGNAER